MMTHERDEHDHDHDAHGHSHENRSDAHADCAHDHGWAPRAHGTQGQPCEHDDEPRRDHGPNHGRAHDHDDEHDHKNAHDHEHRHGDAHAHGHGHGHGHGHHHHHALPSHIGARFALAIGLNIAFVIAEFGYGLVANSTALMADAGHNLSDVLGLVLAWMAAVMARRAPSLRFTYGLRSGSILAAVLNGLLLMLACGAIGWEAVQRLSQPSPVAGLTVSLVAAVGILINGLSAWLFMEGSKADLNLRAAYQHMAADAAISLGVLVAGVAIYFTGWSWLDPALSLAIVVMILVGTWGVMREAIELVLAAVPSGIDPDQVQRDLLRRPGVSEVHDLHIWAMSTTETALTAHLVMPAGHDGDRFIHDTVDQLKRDFAIHHVTLQIEQGTLAHDCALHGQHGQHGQKN